MASNRGSVSKRSMTLDELAQILHAAICCAHPITGDEHDAVEEATEALEELLRRAADADFLPIGHPTC